MAKIISGNNLSRLYSILKPLETFLNYQKVFNEEVVSVMRLILASNATNATSESSFTLLHPIKLYLGSNTGQALSNYLWPIGDCWTVCWPLYHQCDIYQSIIFFDNRYSWIWCLKVFLSGKRNAASNIINFFSF